MNRILAIDIGTTSTKALVVKPNGTVEFSSQVAYPTYYPQPGFAEQDPEELFNAVKKVILEITRQPGEAVGAISFSCAMHSLIAVDDHGRALTPVLLWADTRSTAQAKALRNSETGNIIYQATGTPIHPMSPLCKLMWLKENEPQIFTSAYKFVSIKEYILFKFIHQWVVDYSIASATGLFDVNKLTWMKEALLEAGIDESRLSVGVSPYTIFSGLDKSLADELNLSPETPFVIGSSDGCLANLGSNVMQPGELSLTVGTSGAVRMTSNEFHSDKNHRLFNYRLDSNHFISGGATNNGSVLLSWFSENILREKIDVPSFIDSALKIKPGAEGLLFLPYIYGERAPFYNPDARGIFFGLAQHHTHGHMMRALMEGICFELKSITDAIEENVGPVTRIIASGGFTQSDRWVQLLADIFGKVIEVKGISDASALGAARMGFEALQVKYRFEDSLISKQFYPIGEGDAKVYDQLYRLFGEITNSLLDKFERIAALQKA